MAYKMKYTNGKKADASSFPFKEDSPNKFINLNNILSPVSAVLNPGDKLSRGIDNVFGTDLAGRNVSNEEVEASKMKDFDENREAALREKRSLEKQKQKNIEAKKQVTRQEVVNQAPQGPEGPEER